VNLSPMLSPVITGRFKDARYSALALLAGLLVLSPQSSLAQSAPWVGETLYGEKCEGRYVPGREVLDYRNRASFEGKLNMIETTHFTKGVETLTKGSTSSAMGDIDFTLRVFPNHPRALNSVVQFSLQHKRHPPQERGLPAECYLQRAMEFAPDDAIPYKLYGYYMQSKGRPQKALQAYKQAMRLVPSDAMVHYNAGLVLVQLKRYDEAMELARPLYGAGLGLPGLKSKLIKAGAWEPSPDEIAAYRESLSERAAANTTDSGGEHETDNGTGGADANSEAPAKDTPDIDAAENATPSATEHDSANTNGVTAPG